MFFSYALIALEEMLIMCQMSTTGTPSTCGRLFEWYKLYSKFVWGHCFQMKLTFFYNGFTLSNISSLI